MNSYAEAFAATIVSTPEEIERRLQIQMRMGVSRIDATIIDEAQCVMQTLEVALARGIPIKVAGDTTPGCDCPVCTAARQAEPTRH